MSSGDGRRKRRKRAEADGRPALVIQGGPRSGATVPVSQATTTLGRQSDNDVVLDEVAVSRYHAVIVETDTKYHLRDLGSRNGTLVNRKKIGDKDHVLKHGDVIHLGGSNVSFKFHRPGTRTVTLSAVEPASGVISIDHKARQVFVRDEELEPSMTRKEFDLLMLLDSRRGEAVSRDDIAEGVWPERSDGDVGNHEIEQCVRRVRLRIEDDPSRPVYLVTVRGFGYKLI